jgi:D-glutamate cyclase
MPDVRLISEIETLIRRDPARRGLIGSDGNGPGQGELARAAHRFSKISELTGAALITGFFIPDTEYNGAKSPRSHATSKTRRGNAETDGPPGTVVLADVLASLGVLTTVVTDSLCEPVVRAACSTGSAQNLEILVSPNGHQEAGAWRTSILERPEIRQISHFVAIERVGPGYADATATTSELAAKTGQRVESAALNDWRPGHCSNMRGESIDEFSADLHLLIESAKARNPNVKFIGIGDGGNELGMGRFPRDELISRITGSNAHRIPCRISADATIVAGVSNWGAYALAAAIAVQHDRVDLLAHHTAESQQRLLERIVEDAGAVDGVTRRNEPTVDGLPFLTQIQPWIAIRKRLGLRP